MSKENESFIKMINTLRLQNKNKWYFYTGYVNDKYIELKGYNTWLQILRVDGVHYSSAMEITVGEFKANLLHAITGEPVAI